MLVRALGARFVWLAARRAGADSSTDEAIAKPSFRGRRTADYYYLPNWDRFTVGYICHFSF